MRSTSKGRTRSSKKCLTVLAALAVLLLGVLALALPVQEGSTHRQVAPDCGVEAPAVSRLSATPMRPNVLVVYLDDANYDEMMAFMPKTRQWMEPCGTRFDNFYANNALCCPFRATALTGQHSLNNGVMSNSVKYGGGAPLFNESRSLPPYLRQNGYQTAYVGKYLNGYRDKPKWVPLGWDEWFVPYDNTYEYYGTKITHNGQAVTPPGYVADVYGRHTNRLIERFGESSSKPWVMYVSHLAPHGALLDAHNEAAIPSKKYEGTVLAKDLSRVQYELDVSDKPSWIRALPPLDSADKLAIDAKRVRRAESILAVDDAIDSMFRTLERTGQLNSTLVIVTSDNGFEQGAHRLQYGKILPYDDSTRVGAWVRGPGIPAGVVSKQVTGSVDIGATILDVTSTAVPYPVDGQSLLAPLDNRQMLLEAGSYLMPGVWTGDPTLRSYVAVVDEEYKYVRYWDGQRELYNLEADPKEMVSLVGFRPDLVMEYEAVLERLENCRGAACNITRPDFLMD